MGDTIRNEEYETQFFEFSPTDIYEGVKGIIKDHYEDALSKLEIQMKKIPEHILPEAELTEGMAKLRLTTGKNIDHTLHKLENHLLDNIMKIPQNLLLPEDAEQAVSCSSDESTKLKKEIEDLKMKLKIEKFMEAKLLEEVKEIELTLEAQEKLLSTEFSPSEQASFQEDTEKFEFLAENVEHMRKEIESIEQKYPDSTFHQSLGNMFERDVYSPNASRQGLPDL